MKTVDIFLKHLNISRERAEELIDNVFKIVAKNPKAGFIIEDLKELIELPKTKEEMFLVTFVATSISHDLLTIENPILRHSMALDTMVQILEYRMGGSENESLHKQQNEEESKG